jgi:predicted phage baseplate assembly protein
LGSGDAGQPYQRFTLRQPPLTYVGTADAAGAKSTLEVRVNDQLWAEVPTLYGRGPDEHIYTARTGDDGRTVVQFGDGRNGSRLPTGRENVRVRYRKGIGTSGMVKAGQVSLLVTRPLGVKSVVNPVPGTDAADAEPLESARRTAPLNVLTLDRAVSLQDYEDFALGFAGIAKALATWTWDGEQRNVFITVAGPDGSAPSDAKCRDLVVALHESGDPHVLVRVAPCRLVRFRLEAGVKVQLDRAGEEEQVLTSVRQAVTDAFSFEARSIGEAVALSEVIAALQAVPGVQAVDVDLLYRAGEAPALNDRLAAAFPLAGDRAVPAPAELLMIDAAQAVLKVMA